MGYFNSDNEKLFMLTVIMKNFICSLLKSKETRNVGSRILSFRIYNFIEIVLLLFIMVLEDCVE